MSLTLTFSVTMIFATLAFSAVLSAGDYQIVICQFAASRYGAWCIKTKTNVRGESDSFSSTSTQFNVLFAAC